MKPDEYDIARSVRRLLADHVGGLTMLLGRTRVSDDERPISSLDMGAPAFTRVRLTVPQDTYEAVMAFTLNVYPAVAEDEAVGRLTTSRLGTALTQVINEGPDPALVPKDARGRPWAGPQRLAVYDYAGVPMRGPGRAGPVNPVAVAAWEVGTARIVEDPVDPLRLSLQIDGRISWTPQGRGRPAGETLERLPAQYQARIPLSGLYPSNDLYPLNNLYPSNNLPRRP